MILARNAVCDVCYLYMNIISINPNKDLVLDEANLAGNVMHKHGYMYFILINFFPGVNFVTLSVVLQNCQDRWK